MFLFDITMYFMVKIFKVFNFFYENTRVISSFFNSIQFIIVICVIYYYVLILSKCFSAILDKLSISSAFTLSISLISLI